MTLVLLPLVAVAAVVALVLGVRGRDVVRWAGVAVAVLVVLSIVSLGLLQGRGDDSEGDETGPSATAEAPAHDQQVSVQAAPVRPVDAVVLRPDDSPFPSPATPVDGLVDGDAVYLEAALEGDAEVRQCPPDATDLSFCGVGITVFAPADGVARFLFVVEADLSTPRQSVDCAVEACSIVLLSGDGVFGSVPVVFGESSPSPRLAVTGPAPYSAGEDARVTLSGFAPGTELVLTQCTAPGPSDQRRCGAPAPEVPVVIDADGGAVVAYPVHLGPVGSAGSECRRSQPCAIAVLGASVPVGVGELSLAGSPASDVKDSRVVAGMVLAALLLLGCAVVVARSDWNPPEGDPFEGIVLRVPEGWEDLRAIDDEDEDAVDEDAGHPVTG